MQRGASGFDVDALARADGDVLDRIEGELAAHLARHPEHAERLLPLLASGQDLLIANARRLLTLFDTEALLTIARGFAIDDATARFEILGVLWAHLVAMPPHERQQWLEAVAPYLRPGLVDDRVPARGFADPERLELEHEYRICDETYLFLARLLEPGFDDSRFAVLEEDARRAVVSQFDRRFNTLFASPTVAARNAAKAPAALTEITVVARFPNPYAQPDTKDERDKAAAAKWSPSLRDFLAVAAVDTPDPGKAVFEVGSFLELLSAVLFVRPGEPDKSPLRPAQSVKRVNIISHGNPGLIAMSGTVDTDGVVMLRTRGQGAGDLSGPIDVAAVQAASDPALQLANGKPLALSLRDRMAPDAEVFLLACHTGMGGSLPLMHDLKKLFAATIRAYSKEIAYCPLLDDAKILDRAYTAVGDCKSGSKRGFKHLAPDVAA